LQMVTRKASDHQRHQLLDRSNTWNKLVYLEVKRGQ
jgi:hypothetical protein